MDMKTPARKVGEKTAVGRGNRGQCHGCLEPFANGQRVTAIGRDRTGPIEWFCDDCVQRMEPTPRGITNAPPAELFEQTQ